MNTESICRPLPLRGPRQPTALRALADALKSTPRPEIRRQILRRLKRRLREEEFVVSVASGANSSQDFPSPTDS